MSLNEEEKRQVIQQIIEDKKACSTCAPLLWDMLQEPDRMTVDFVCVSCYRKHYYHRRLFCVGQNEIQWM